MEKHSEINTAKKVLFLSGTRADFGKLKPLITQVENHSHLEAHIFATGMHMLSMYGYTFHEIEKSGFSNIFPCYNQTPSSSQDMDFVLANTIQGLGSYIRELKPDIIIVHGDRIEALAGAIVGSLNNIIVGHIEGGEISGTIDDSIRHSVSKLAHVHFVANEDAQNRLLKMGESPNSIFIIGSPDIDVMLQIDLPSLSNVLKHYSIPFKKYGIVIYHAVTTELDLLKVHINELITALNGTGDNYVIIYPNNDIGSDIILSSIKKLENDPMFHVIPSLRFEYFLTLLKNAKYILGNSSVGIREAPVYGIPTINLGSRQNNRFNYKSIINIPEKAELIINTIKKIPSQFEPSLYFGKGNSADCFIEILESNDDIWSIKMQKIFHD